MTGQLLIKETQLQRIIRKTGRKPCECKCSLCRMQCHTPCLGTPQDIERLIDAGYAVIDIPIPMIQAVAGDEYCIFYHNGLCELHDKGLKPTEGRLSHHSTRLDNFKASKSISWNVAKEWLSEENAEVIERVADKFSRN